MRISIFASSSGGNCLLVTSGDVNILVDAGISMRRISESLARMNLSPQAIDGVLITHEHSDHISGLSMLAKHCDAPIYAPRTVAARLSRMLPQLESRLCRIKAGEHFSIKGVDILPFHTPHDTDESVGYRIGDFAVATDMGHVTEEIESAVSGAKTVLIESNYDEEMLRYGPYPVPLKRRILSPNGHLSNYECGKFARKLVENGTKRVILGHLSLKNNTPSLASGTVAEALAGLPAELMCAPEIGCMTLHTGEF